MNTKRLITASIFALISASTAQAADVIVPQQPAKASSPAFVAPNFTWAGFYLGGQVAGFSSRTDMSIVGKDKSVPLSKDFSPKLSGFEGGLYIGSNIDLGDNFIFGIDTDLILSGQKHTKTITLGASDDAEVDNLVARSRRSARSASGISGSMSAGGRAASQIAAKPVASTAPVSGVSAESSAKPVTSGAAKGRPLLARSGSEETTQSVASAPAGSADTVAHSDNRVSGVSQSHSRSIQSNGGYGVHSRGASNGAGHSSHPHSAHHGAGAHSYASNPHGNPHGANNAARHGVQASDKKASSVYGIEQMRKVVSELGLERDSEAETLSHTLKQNWAGATRVRIGFAADRFMPYVAGGVAYAQLQDTLSISLKKEDGRVVSSKNLTDETKTMIGYTVGGGIDFAMLDNVIVRAEYRYSDFGKKKFAKEKIELKYKTNDFRVGVAYKF
ncbi:outer membrane protein [Bartonella vinsonii]|uniref:Hemin binding protein n=1 Tax=Bartonella vinsonii subsp. berkhoffii str. Tweed TaxID=1094502 RepID=N6UYZ0_BARVB|nr:outer membrane protein [Bartonella vinsonii]ENN95303.1 hemin binding protein [Bartonella vinsonii subsp. berkhoffii str. Tweed]